MNPLRLIRRPFVADLVTRHGTAHARLRVVWRTRHWSLILTTEAKD